MDKECEYCAAMDGCPTVCMPGSILCMERRLQSGQTKGDYKLRQQTDTGIKRCPYCGMVIK